MKNWRAQKTNNPQGADFKEVGVNGKVSRLEFTIKPTSDFWRAGFKLFDPNSNVFPLLNRDSILFHLGSTQSRDEYGFTAYKNGLHIDELNKTKKYPANRLLTIRLEIAHNNILKVFVNNSLEFKPRWHLENPDIREKVAMIAWGDKNDYSVEFTNISFGNWKESSSTNPISTKNKTALHVTGNQNVFVNSSISGSAIVNGEKRTFNKTTLHKSMLENKSKNVFSSFLENFINPQKFIGSIIVAFIAGLLLLIVSRFGFEKKDINSLSGETSKLQHVTETIPTVIINTPIPHDDFILISNGQSYTDSESDIVVGLLDITAYNKAAISVTIPNSETAIHENVVPGKVYNFDSMSINYSITIKTISFVGNYIEITIRQK